MAAAVCELIWIKNLLQHLHTPHSKAAYFSVTIKLLSILQLISSSTNVKSTLESTTTLFMINFKLNLFISYMFHYFTSLQIHLPNYYHPQTFSSLMQYGNYKHSFSISRESIISREKYKTVINVFSCSSSRPI